jgi:lipoprotein-anchoring transpeptidase ErfK/SrfK
MRNMFVRLAIVGASAAIASATPALAKEGASAATAVSLAEAATALTPGKYLWEDDDTLGPVTVLISLPDQRAYVYRGQTLVAVSAVSTGKEGKETPVGVFNILQKKVMNHSNLYENAPMPFMQRLTWDGIAIHAGRNPGFPASHGCIRVPTEFAKKLYAATEMGATVEVTDIAYMEGTAAPMSDAEMTAKANATASGDSLGAFLASR